MFGRLKNIENGDLQIEEFTKRVREMASQLLATLHNLSLCTKTAETSSEPFSRISLY